ncbi:hypothetical protein D3C81_1303490 [compost metagenome]
MAIKNVFGFDQFAERLNANSAVASATIQQWFTEEGYPFTFESAYTSYAEVANYSIIKFRDRNWFGQNFQMNSTGHRLHNRTYATLSTLYGAETAKTKWYGGLRYYKEMNTYTGSMAMVRICGVEVALLNTSPNGEHYLEWCIDWTTNKLTIWLDDAYVTEYNVAFTIGHLFEFGRMNGPYWYNFGPLYFTDFYFLADTGDGATSKRLGPIKVSAVLLDEAVVPAGWSKQSTVLLPVENYTSKDILNNKLNGANNNYLNNGVLSATSSAPGQFSLAEPPIVSDEILYVQVRATMLRDAASSDKAVTKVSGGGVDRGEVTTILSNTYKDQVLGEFYKKDDGSSFKAVDVGQIGITIKSVPGGA